MGSLPVRAAVAVVLSALCGLLLAADGLDPRLALAVDDLSQLAAAAAASLACAAAARRSPPRMRRAWALLAIGTGSWAAGQAVWTAYELGPAGEVPFPSWADVGFLLFPVVSAVGLLRWLAADARALTRARDLVDGAIIAGSLLVVSWVTTLAPVHAAGGSDALALALSLAYPVGDVVLATLVLLALARSSSGERAVLVLVGTGLGGLAVADSIFVVSYLEADGTFAVGGLVGVGWLLGFLLIAVAASGAGAPPRPAPDEVPDGAPAVLRGTPWRLRAALPYVPLVAAEALVGARLVSSGRVEPVELGLGGLLVVLVLARQFMAMDENRRLVAQLAAAQQELRHRALHDPLTGLANRALFVDRLQHALALLPRGGGSVTVLFCDLDGFKAVNDRLGHAAGDTLLTVVADRLRGCLRPADTVARFGGDEFAVLLEDPSDPAEVAGRLLAAVARPCALGGVPVAVSMSVGVAVHEGPEHPPDGDAALVALADAAMYAAKAAGGGRAVLSGAGVPAPSARPR